MATKLEIELFSSKIEEQVQKYGCNYIDAVVAYCDDIGIEIEVASTLLTNQVKNKIRKDAENLNLLEKSARLPI